MCQPTGALASARSSCGVTKWINIDIVMDVAGAVNIDQRALWAPGARLACSKTSEPTGPSSESTVRLVVLAQEHPAWQAIEHTWWREMRS